MGARGDESLHSYKDERGFLEIRRARPGVLIFIERGYLVGSCGQSIIDAMNQELKLSPKLTFFIDAERLDGYDPPVRTMPTDWLKKNTAKVVAQHMLVKSQIARMGLAVAGLALGAVIRGYTSRADFDRAIESARGFLPTRARRRPARAAARSTATARPRPMGAARPPPRAAGAGAGADADAGALALVALAALAGRRRRSRPVSRRPPALPGHRQPAYFSRRTRRRPCI